MTSISRRRLLQGSGALLATPALATEPHQDTPPAAARSALPIRFALKYGMVGVEGSMVEKFKLLKRLGYDGVELDSPNNLHREEVLAAVEVSGLPVHGVVDSIHWRERLSSPDPKVRETAVTGLETAIRDIKDYGGSSVLLVPGLSADPEKENHDQVWERSIEGIQQVLPLAAELGIHILIENVWNKFCYEHDGPPDQSAARFVQYIDAIDSPWVGMYFDLGNHQKYGNVAEWVRQMGRRIVKLDVKDWGIEAGWAKIGDGDVDWPAVREALTEIGYTGWATAEVGGGDEKRLAEILERMRRALAPA